MNVVVITVTYNSSESLRKTIQAVLRQTIDIDKIVIADNCSNFENKQKLREIESLSDKIEILWLESNTGGAGGFYMGMKYALENFSPKWYWLMDDDAYPDDKCLETLIEYSKKLNNVGFVAPIIWGIDNKSYQLYHPRKKAKGLVYKFKPVADTFEALVDVQQIDVDAFVGPLISCDAVKACGLPRPELFIEGDDTDYTFRITRKYYGYLIKKAKMNHRDITNQGEIHPKSWWKNYYWYRNTMLFQLQNLKGISRLLGILYVLAWGIKSKIQMYRDSRYEKYRKFRWNIMKRGLIDGLKRNSGANLMPADYFDMLKKWEENGVI